MPINGDHLFIMSRGRKRRTARGPRMNGKESCSALSSGRTLRSVSSMPAIDETDKKVIALIQGDLPLNPRPFASLAERIGLKEEDFLARVRNLKRSGVIRRFGATLRHQEAGFSSNAMVAWVVPEERVDEVGELMAGFKEVTHCYQRQRQKEWPYNLYTMIHGDNRDQCRRLAESISRKTGIDEYALLFSEKEFKKTSMEYFGLTNDREGMSHGQGTIKVPV